VNEETIVFRLEQIEKKIDALIDVQMQTKEQEIRLSNLEADVKDIKTQSTKRTERWLSPLVSAIVSGFVAFIFIKVGLK
jgi:hypothetical protein